MVLAVSLCAAPKLQLEKLSKAEAPDDVCACTSRDGNKPVYFLDAESEHPVVRLDGKKLLLDKGKSTKPAERPRVGDTFFEEFSAGEVTFRFDHTLTFVCAPDDESCEVAKFSSTLTVKSGPVTRVYKNLKSACGC